MLREMVLADVEAVSCIEQAVQMYPWTRGSFIGALNHGYVCRVDSEFLVSGHSEKGVEIRAYMVVMPAFDEAELLTIGVAENQQRKGLGRMMLREVFALSQEMNIRRIFLEVRVSNLAAIALYQSLGFKQIGIRRDYYHNARGCEDAITMACELKDEGNE